MADAVAAAPVVDKAATPAETPDAAAAPAKAPTLQEELDGVLKKHGGLKYKVAKGERAISDSQSISRMLERVGGVDAAVEQTAKERRELDDWKQRRGSLGKLPPRERAKAIAELVGDEKLAREAYEAEIVADFERSESEKRLPPEAIEARRALEAKDAELTKYRRQAEAAQAEHEQLRTAKQVEQDFTRLSTVSVTALQKVGIKPELVDSFMPTVARYLDRAADLGLEVSDDDVAQLVTTERDGLAMEWVTGGSAESFVDKLEAGGHAAFLDKVLDVVADRLRKRLANGGRGSTVQTSPKAAAPVVNGIKRAHDFWSTTDVPHSRD